MEQVTKIISDYTPYLSSSNVTLAATAVVAIYVLLILPNLGKNIVSIFDNMIVRVMLCFLIILLGKVNPLLAVLAFIGLFATLISLNLYKTKEGMAIFNTEHDNIRRRLLNDGKDNIPIVPQMSDDRYPDQVPCFSQISGYDGHEFARVGPLCDDEKPLPVVASEEQKVQEIITKVNVKEEELGRKLTREEMTVVADEVNDEYNFLKGTCNDEFCVDNLELLHCAGREPPRSDVSKNYDDCIRKDGIGAEIVGFGDDQDYKSCPSPNVN